MPRETLGCAEPTLRWWKDFWSSQPVVFRALRRAPLLVAYFVFSTVAGAFIEPAEKILRFGDSVAMLAASLCIIYEVWAQISGMPRQDHKQDYVKIYQAFGAGWLYGIGVILGGLLLLGPGIYVLVSASLAIVFIAVDNYPVIASFDASRKLIRGHFWASMRYLGATPVLMGLTVFLAFLIPSIAIGLAFGETPTPLSTALDKTLELGVSLGLLWAVLSAVPMQVRLFHYLKIKSGELPNPSPHT